MKRMAHSPSTLNVETVLHAAARFGRETDVLDAAYKALNSKRGGGADADAKRCLASITSFHGLKYPFNDLQQALFDIQKMCTTRVVALALQALTSHMAKSVQTQIDMQLLLTAEELDAARADLQAAVQRFLYAAVLAGDNKVILLAKVSAVLLAPTNTDDTLAAQVVAQMQQNKTTFNKALTGTRPGSQAAANAQHSYRLAQQRAVAPLLQQRARSGALAVCVPLPASADGGAADAGALKPGRVCLDALKLARALRAIDAPDTWAYPDLKIFPKEVRGTPIAEPVRAHVKAALQTRCTLDLVPGQAFADTLEGELSQHLVVVPPPNTKLAPRRGVVGISRTEFEAFAEEADILVARLYHRGRSIFFPVDINPLLDAAAEQMESQYPVCLNSEDAARLQLVNGGAVLLSLFRPPTLTHLTIRIDELESNVDSAAVQSSVNNRLATRAVFIRGEGGDAAGYPFVITAMSPHPCVNVLRVGADTHAVGFDIEYRKPNAGSASHSAAPQLARTERK